MTPSPNASSSEAANTRQRRKVFAIGSFRFQFSNTRWVDSFLDSFSWVLEGIVYLIGPLLIVLALAIISLMVYTFANVMLPMMRMKHEKSPWKNAYLALHCMLVAFLLLNILFNYFYCVITRHAGPNYHKIVRELADATNFSYPETPAEVAQFRQDFEDLMTLRIRRRNARNQEAAAAAAAAATAASSDATAPAPTHGTTTGGPNGQMTHRKASTQPGPTSNGSSPAPQPQAPVRVWTLMGPFEWGFCSMTNQPKPPRSHYDHVSRTLVLNLDHYCPWMFNAIGYFNYRYFLNFLIYIGVGMLYGALLTWKPFMLLDSDDYFKQARMEHRNGLPKGYRLQPMLPYRDEKMLVSLCFMLSVAVGLAVATLCVFHIYLALSAQTTIEFHGNWSNRKRAKQYGQKWKNPYAQSLSANWQQVYGRRYWLLALLPSAREPEFLPVPIPGHPGRTTPRTEQYRQEDERVVVDDDGAAASCAGVGTNDNHMHGSHLPV